MNRLTICALGIGVLLSGCALEPKYSCGAPQGVGCISMEQIEKQLDDGTLPTLHKTKFVGGADEDEKEEVETDENKPRLPDTRTEGRTERTLMMAKPGQPFYDPPEIIRAKLRAFSDETGDYQSESYLFVKFREGRWSNGVSTK